LAHSSSLAPDLSSHGGAAGKPQVALIRRPTHWPTNQPGRECASLCSSRRRLRSCPTHTTSMRSSTARRAYRPIRPPTRLRHIQTQPYMAGPRYALVIPNKHSPRPVDFSSARVPFFSRGFILRLNARYDPRQRDQPAGMFHCALERDSLTISILNRPTSKTPEWALSQCTNRSANCTAFSAFIHSLTIRNIRFNTCLTRRMSPGRVAISTDERHSAIPSERSC
jgi:hypothetical protein